MLDEFANGFLGEADAGEPDSFRPPPRKHARVTPIVDARLTFQLIEAAILSAQSSVELAYWDLQTDLPLQLAEARADGRHTWADLLLHAAERGVTIRIIFNDFDPDLLSGFHGEAWQSYSELVTTARQREATAGFPMERLQVICRLHPNTIPPSVPQLRFAILAERATMLAELNEIAQREGLGSALFRLNNLPRVWPIITVDRASRRFSLTDAAFRPVHVGSFHEKFCIVDDRIAFCGGIDAKATVLDDRQHRQSPFRHDIACVIEGPCVVDIVQHFNGRWDSGLAPFKDFVDTVNPLAVGAPLKVTPLHPSRPPRRDRPHAGTGIAQLLRTRADTIVNPPTSRPSGQRWDHWETYERLIGSAKRFIYIENQYLRWPGIGDLIIDRFRANRALRVIIVLPFTPEEAATGGDIDVLTLHGMHLQLELLRRLKAELKENVGMFTLVAKEVASASDPPPTGVLFRSPLIYVHTKVCIVDDAFAIIGSANLDGLSLFVCDELSIGWFHPRQVANFRVSLWQELLGVSGTDMAEWKPEEFLMRWFRIASMNVTAAPEQRSGFVVPLDLDLLNPGQAAAFIPDILARGPGPETAGPEAPRRKRLAAGVVS